MSMRDRFFGRRYLRFADPDCTCGACQPDLKTPAPFHHGMICPGCGKETLMVNPDAPGTLRKFCDDCQIYV